MRLIAGVDEAGRGCAMGPLVVAGVTTAELDRLAAARTRARGASPAFLGYQGYPASLCISVNDEVVHGIPSPRRVLREGDVVGLDFGVVKDGFFGDAARTVPVGRIPPEARRLLADAVEQLKRLERPFLNWAGKAERLSFDVPTLPLFVHERLSTKAILETLKARYPASLRVCALLDKLSRRRRHVPIDYRGFEIPDKFVVGYGLDYAGLYRNLPFVCVLKPEAYT